MIIDHDIVLMKVCLIEAGFEDAFGYPLLSQCGQEFLPGLQLLMQLSQFFYSFRTVIIPQSIQTFPDLLEIAAHGGAVGLFQHDRIGLRTYQGHQALTLDRTLALVVDSAALNVFCLQTKIQLLLVYRQLPGNGFRHTGIGLFGTLQEEGLLTLHPILHIRTQQFNDGFPPLLFQLRTINAAEKSFADGSRTQGALHRNFGNRTLGVLHQLIHLRGHNGRINGSQSGLHIIQCQPQTKRDTVCGKSLQRLLKQRSCTLEKTGHRAAVLQLPAVFSRLLRNHIPDGRRQHFPSGIRIGLLEISAKNLPHIPGLSCIAGKIVLHEIGEGQILDIVGQGLIIVVQCLYALIHSSLQRIVEIIRTLFYLFIQLLKIELRTILQKIPLQHLCTCFQSDSLISEFIYHCSICFYLRRYRQSVHGLVHRFHSFPNVCPISKHTPDHDAKLRRNAIHQNLLHIGIVAKKSLQIQTGHGRNIEIPSQLLREPRYKVRMLYHHGHCVCMMVQGITKLLRSGFSLSKVILPGLQRRNHVRHESLHSGLLRCPAHFNVRTLPHGRCILYTIPQTIRTIPGQVFELPQRFQRLLLIDLRCNTVLLLLQLPAEILTVLISRILQCTLCIGGKQVCGNIAELLHRNTCGLPQNITQHTAAESVGLSSLCPGQPLIQNAFCAILTVLLNVSANILIYTVQQKSR